MAILSQNVLEGIRTAEANMGYEPLPEGEYTVKVDSADCKPTKNGKGQLVKVNLVVLGPKYQGRKLFDNFNVMHDSTEVMRIARQQLKGLMIAGGMTQEQINRFNDTDQLVGLTFNVRVKIEEANGQYDAQNRIKSYKKAEGVSVPPSAPTFAAPAPGGSFSEAFSTPAVASTAEANPIPSWFK